MAATITSSPYGVDPEFRSDEYLPITKLNHDDDNYFIWKKAFLNFLRFKNKVGYVDGTVEIPEPSSPLHDCWRTNNARVKTWMMNSVSGKLRDHALYEEAAHKAWEYFRLIFVPSVEFRVYELRQRIAMLRQGGDSVGRYFGKLMRAWGELDEYDPVPECVCGGRLRNEGKRRERRSSVLCF